MPDPMLPRIDPAVYRLVEWSLCQVAYVTAKELMRVRPETDMTDAYQEGWELAQALNESGRPLIPGQEPQTGVAAPPEVQGDDLVHWPTLVCSLNSYAQLEPLERAAVRSAISKGAALWELGIGGSAVRTGGRFEPAALCDPKAVNDPDYIPEPPCVPKDVATAAGVAAASFLGFAGLALLVRLLRG